MCRESYTYITLELLAWTRLKAACGLKMGRNKCLFLHCLGLPQGRGLKDGALLYASVEQEVEINQGAEEGKGTNLWDPEAIPSISQWKHGPVVVLPIHTSKSGLYH